MSKYKSKSLVNKATADDRTPAPGWCLQELAKKTRSIEECRTIEELVLKKLDKTKPYVKKKSLIIIKYIANNGDQRWRRSWQRHTDKIRACAQFRGPPDPVYGDSPYADVRKAAKDAMTAIFSNVTKDTGKITRRIDSLGSEDVSISSTRGQSRFSTGSRGVIHSTPMTTSAPRPGTVMRNEGIGNTKYIPKHISFDSVQRAPAYSANMQFSHKNPHSTTKIDNRKGRDTSKRPRGAVGGIWGGDDSDDGGKGGNLASRGGSGFDESDDEYPADDGADSARAASALNSSLSSSARNRRLASSSGSGRSRGTTSNGDYERKWVEDVTASGGVGIKIHDIKKRVLQYANLSHSHVLEFLDERLSDPSWQTQAKALTLIEALLESKASDVAEYFGDSPDNIEELQTAKKGALRKKAKVIIEMLGIGESAESDDNGGGTSIEPQSSSHSTQPQKSNGGGGGSMEDMLGFGGGGGNAAAQNDEEEDDDDEFAGMDFEEDDASGIGSVQKPPPQTNIHALAEAAAAQKEKEAAQEIDPFAEMDIPESGPPKTGGDFRLDDFISPANGRPSNGHSTGQGSAGGGFAFIQSGQAPPNPAASGPSGFDFMQSGGPSGTATGVVSGGSGASPATQIPSAAMNPTGLLPMMDSVRSSMSQISAMHQQNTAMIQGMRVMHQSPGLVGGGGIAPGMGMYGHGVPSSGASPFLGNPAVAPIYGHAHSQSASSGTYQPSLTGNDPFAQILAQAGSSSQQQSNSSGQAQPRSKKQPAKDPFASLATF